MFGPLVRVIPVDALRGPRELFEDPIPLIVIEAHQEPATGDPDHFRLVYTVDLHCAGFGRRLPWSEPRHMVEAMARFLGPLPLSWATYRGCPLVKLASFVVPALAFSDDRQTIEGLRFTPRCPRNSMVGVTFVPGQHRDAQGR